MNLPRKKLWRPILPQYLANLTQPILHKDSHFVKLFEFPVTEKFVSLLLTLVHCNT